MRAVGLMGRPVGVRRYSSRYLARCAAVRKRYEARLSCWPAVGFQSVWTFAGARFILGERGRMGGLRR